MCFKMGNVRWPNLWCHEVLIIEKATSGDDYEKETDYEEDIGCSYSHPSFDLSKGFSQCKVSLQGKRW